MWASLYQISDKIDHRKSPFKVNYDMFQIKFCFFRNFAANRRSQNRVDVPTINYGTVPVLGHCHLLTSKTHARKSCACDGSLSNFDMKNYIWQHKLVKTCQQVIYGNDGNFSQSLYWSSVFYSQRENKERRKIMVKIYSWNRIKALLRLKYTMTHWYSYEHLFIMVKQRIILIKTE